MFQFLHFHLAIFGQSLEETMAFEHKLNRRLPYIMEQCVHFLTKNGLDVEGIFRFNFSLITTLDSFDEIWIIWFVHFYDGLKLPGSFVVFLI